MRVCWRIGKRRFFAALLFVLILPVLGLAHGTAEEVKERLLQIGEFVSREQASAKIPGLSVGVVYGAETVYLQGFGKANEKGDPVTEDTPFIIGSTGKAITALAIRQLLNEGMLAMEDAVKTHLPWWTLKDSQGGEITIEKLLNQTSGFSTLSGVEAYTYRDNVTLQELTREINRRVTLVRPVGEAYEYSNLNFIVLGAVVEAVSGMSYADYVTQQIFLPMGMERSYALISSAREQGLSQGYSHVYGQVVPVNVPYPMGQVPSGYQISTARDMAKYLVFALNNGYAGGQSIIPNNELSAPQDPLAAFDRQAPYYDVLWQLTKGLDTRNYNGFYGYVGATPSYNAVILLNPKEHLGVVVLCNDRHATVTAQMIGNGITDILLGKGIPKPLKPVEEIRAPLAYPLSVLLILLLEAASCVFHLKRNARTRLGRVLATIHFFALNLALPLLILVALPLYYGNRWPYFLSADMENTLPIFALGVAFLISGIVKLIAFLRYCRRNKAPG